MTDKRYLVLRRQGYYVSVEVPPSVRPMLGKKRLQRTLATRSLETARRKRWEVVRELKEAIEAARPGREGDPLVEQALFLRDALEGAAMTDEEAGGGPDDPATTDVIRDMAVEAAARADAKRPGSGATFAGVFHGTATPLLHHQDRWLVEGGAHGPYEERTKGDHRRALKELSDWLATIRRPATLQAVTRPIAGRFVSEHLIPSGRAPKTVTKIISSLASYWVWLRKRGHVSDEQRSPWVDQAPAKGARAGRGRAVERPFTDDEVRALLGGSAAPIMADFLRVALLSGLRREEIGRLTIADTKGGVFVIHSGKTSAARRRVPVHPDLVELVARRSAGKTGAAYLFHDLTSKRPERTDAIGKQFGRYRRDLGIQDGEGRRSLVNFHSCRRWFDTAAINAGQPPHVVSLVMGHEEGRKGMTLGRYWGGAEDAALRKVVEAVQLPRVG